MIQHNSEENSSKMSNAKFLSIFLECPLLWDQFTISNLEKLVQYVGGVILMNFIWPQMCKKVWTSLSQNDWIILVVCVFVNNACTLTLKNEWSFGCGFGIYFLKHLLLQSKYLHCILYIIRLMITYIEYLIFFEI